MTLFTRPRCLIKKTEILQRQAQIGPTGDARVDVICEGVGLMRDGVVQCHAAFETVSAGDEFPGADQSDAEHSVPDDLEAGVAFLLRKIQETLRPDCLSLDDSVLRIVGKELSPQQWECMLRRAGTFTQFPRALVILA